MHTIISCYALMLHVGYTYQTQIFAILFYRRWNYMIKRKKDERYSDVSDNYYFIVHSEHIAN